MLNTATIADDLHTVTAELTEAFSRLNLQDVEHLATIIMDSKVVFTAGAGRSGLLLKCCAMRLMHLGRPVYVVGEIVTPSITSGDLLLIASGSGETGSLVSMAHKAKQLGARIALITANPNSTIAKLADVTVRIPAFSPKADVSGYVESAQPMGNLFEQSMFILSDAIVMELMRRMEMTSESMFTRHANLE